MLSRSSKMRSTSLACVPNVEFRKLHDLLQRCAEYRPAHFSNLELFTRCLGYDVSAWRDVQRTFILVYGFEALLRQVADELLDNASNND